MNKLMDFFTKICFSFRSTIDFVSNFKQFLSQPSLELTTKAKAGACKVQAKSEPGNHISCSRECKRV
jgi:hypothetical protein